MTGSQVIKKFLAQIVGGVDVENEQIRFNPEDHALGFFQGPRQVDDGAWGHLV